MNLNCPMEFEFALDNGGEEAGGTKDRYTIQLLLNDGEDSYLIGTDEGSYIWDAGEFLSIDLEEITEEDTHLGKEIGWEELPERLRNHINRYFGGLLSY